MLSQNMLQKRSLERFTRGLNVIIVNPGLILGGKFNNSSMKKMLKIARSNFIFYPIGNIAIIDINDV